ncbi:MAG: hypothetical protein GY880_27595 [Planctomycetaceae bacterium]|nr:hypothetical protein [Planctomycetaceae bacterium]MCP4778002.1 hypothetical protein [Planctomycetaceae bacterium]
MQLQLQQLAQLELAQQLLLEHSKDPACSICVLSSEPKDLREFCSKDQQLQHSKELVQARNICVLSSEP